VLRFTRTVKGHMVEHEDNDTMRPFIVTP